MARRVDKPPNRPHPERRTPAPARLLVAVLLTAWAAPPFPSAHADDLTRDSLLTLAARTHLARDAALAPLNLGVSVRNGVATLWGAVPSSDLARQARDRLRQLRGVAEVRDELTVTTPEGERVVPPSVLAQPAPPAEPRRTGPAVQPGPVRARPAARRPPSEAVSLSAPVPLTGPPPAREPAEDLSSSLRAAQQSEPRFRAVRLELRQRVVYLRGSLAQGRDVMDLAQRVSRIPGVERVVLDVK
jgi:osmotically-inducible protein OsmY